MLVLTRRLKESIVINPGSDEAATVQILGIYRNQVRLGILAPKSIPVHRKEIYLRILESGDNRTDRAYPNSSIDSK